MALHFYNYARMKIDSCDSLPLEKALPLHKIIILIKSIKFKTTTNVLLEKNLYQLTEK